MRGGGEPDSFYCEMAAMAADVLNCRQHYDGDMQAMARRLARIATRECRRCSRLVCPIGKPAEVASGLQSLET